MNESRLLPLLHLITELNAGGAQSALLRLLSGLDRSRYAPIVACYYNGDGMVAQKIRALDVPVHDLGMRSKWRIDAFARLGALIRRQRPTILHTWMFHANVPGRVLGRALGVPVIIGSERTMGSENRTRYRLNAATARYADAIICVSQNVADFARDTIQLPADKLVVVPNGIDLTSVREKRAEGRGPRDQGQGPVELLYLGRLEPVKGVQELIEAAAILAAATPADAWRLTLMGDGALRTELSARIAETGLQQRISMLPAQPDALQRLAAYDALVLPSRWEGMPNVAIEAMAAGLPVVATAVGGTPEVVLHGETGLLVPANDPAAFAGAMARIVADGDLRARLGAAGRARVEAHFTIQATVRRTEALYERLLAAKGIAPAWGTPP